MLVNYDPLTVAAALGWDGIEFRDVTLRIERRDGRLVERVDPDGTRLRIATAVDGLGFNRLWLDVVTSHPGRP